MGYEPEASRTGRHGEGPRAQLPRLAHSPEQKQQPWAWPVSRPRPKTSDQVVTDLAISIGESSMGSLAAYRDLYQVAEAAGLDAGLAYEYSHDYEITDTDERLAGFR